MFNPSVLMQWYRSAARDLPWRQTTAPYPVWLSEVILQQTRVEQGIGYFHRFLEAFPTISDLAAASEEDVLRLWQGLGYYSRARNLHAAARQVQTEFNGEFPDTYAEILKLKGVGPYTAAAIASFCFKEATPVIDGNVNRVMSRMMALESPVDGNDGKRAIHQRLEEVIPDDEPDTFNQAMMEWGALICTPKQPKCQECPMQAGCDAFKRGTVMDFPKKKSKTRVQERWLYCFVVTDGTNLIMRHRDQPGIWQNLYDFPTFEYDKQPTEEAVIAEFIATHPDWWNDRCTAMESTTHLLSHRKLRVAFYLVEVEVLPAVQNEPFLRQSLDKWRELPVPRLVERLLENWVQPNHGLGKNLRLLF